MWLGKEITINRLQQHLETLCNRQL